jgi:hypothetical protein
MSSWRPLLKCFDNDPGTPNSGSISGLEPVSCDARPVGFTFGPVLLVNPVIIPMYFGVGSKVLKGVSKIHPIYLPTGSNQYDFWTGKQYTDEQTIVVDAPLDMLLPYVRA